ncbi:MAG: radical SAM protein [Anaerolineales bacterium]|nr:MAG: radical SAM protein [Anaerolineales bacterium]
MILDVTKSTLPEIKNPALRTYANIYVQIYQDFMEQVRQMGLEIEEQDTTAAATQKIMDLRKKGAVIRNSDKSIYINRISPSCVACQTGAGSSTFFISLKCHRDCFYCFNPNQENYEYFREHTRDVVAELDETRAAGQRLQHIALTGGEPLLHKDETYRFFERARELYPNSHTRLYTSGDHIDRPALESLQKSGLQEIRFSIRMHDLAGGHRHTYDNIALARGYIQNVMVEMPVLPNTLEEMKDVLIELDRLGVFGINLLEFCFPFNNVETYRGNDYKVRARPFRVLYDYWYAGGLPIAGSETVCLGLIDFALDAGLQLGVHYCSLENKHTGQVHRQNSGHNLPKHMAFSQRDYFLKSAKVFGDDIPAVRQAFDTSGYGDYVMSEEHNSLEFHVNRISSLKKMEVDIGISSSVLEMREAGPVLRELKVDVTTPQTFRLSKDI